MPDANDARALDDLRLLETGSGKPGHDQARRQLGTSRKPKGYAMVPMALICAMAKVRSAAPIKLAIELQRRHRVERTDKIKLGNISLAALGIDRKAKQRALKELEACGLVLIERRTRRSPIIHLIGPAWKSPRTPDIG